MRQVKPLRRSDGFEPSGVTFDPRKVKETAPEVNQGVWRERSYTPRPVVGRSEVVDAMQHALEGAKRPNGVLDEVRASLVSAWTPMLRQVLEQAGGDGLDVYITEALKPSGAKAKVVLVEELRSQAARIAAATTLDEVLADANVLLHVVRRTLTEGTPQKLSFRGLERDLEGRLEINDFLDIFFQSTPNLLRKAAELETTVESFRQQLRAMPGRTPGGIYWNFARFKSEKALIAAELKRRSG